MNSRLLYLVPCGLLGWFALLNTAHADESPANSVTQTNSLPDFDSLLKLAEQGQFSIFFNSNVIDSLTAEQCDQIALIAAKSLVSTNGTKGANSDGVTLLEFLNEQRLIQTPEAIPYLIDRLSTRTREAPNFMNYDLLNFLNSLTGRNVGYVIGNDNWLRTNQIAVADWWENWWRENEDLHPICDKQLKIILRNEILATDAKITQARPAPNFMWDSSVHFLLQNGPISQGGERSGGPKDTLFAFYYGHTPGNTAKNGPYIPPHDDILCLSGEFLTKNPGETNEPSYDVRLGNKKFPMQEIYSRTIPGTGIAIKVEIATTNAELMNLLCEYLNE